MTSVTISTINTAGVYVAPGYATSITIAGSGGIEPNRYDSLGALWVSNPTTLESVVNHGIIEAFSYGFPSEAGVLLSSPTRLTNTSEILGGVGARSATPTGGGDGVYAVALSSSINTASTVDNSGVIGGGAGGYGLGSQGQGGYGGLGVAISSQYTAGTLLNSGTVTGGYGGGAQVEGGGAGGIGVLIEGPGYVSNTGFIRGGFGGSGSYDVPKYGAAGGAGGVGVDVFNAPLSNSGTIMGGGGGGIPNIQDGGGGGLGVYLSGDSGFSQGLIEGGLGNAGSLSGGFGGFGVVLTNYGSLTNNGIVIGGNGGEGLNKTGESGNGGVGLEVQSGAIANNSFGKVFGGAGGYARLYVLAGAGGAGAYVDGTLTSHATIAGGAGGNFYGDGGNQRYVGLAAGRGGDGVDMRYDSSSLTNLGIILGGQGGNMYGRGGHAGRGGIGVVAADAGTFTNDGTVIGGHGGYTYQPAYNNGYGGAGGVGVYVAGDKLVMNAGTIIGGVGGSNIYTGAAGGAGVVVYGGTFVDSGAVRGGAGGVSQFPGAAGDAVYFVSPYQAGTLVLDPGASCSGLVTGNSGVANVLELAGTSAATLSGIGTEFTDFGVVSFASGAQRTVEGKVANLHSIAGFALHDAIVLDSFTTTIAAVSSTSIVLNSGAAKDAITLSGSTAKEVLIADGGGKTTISAAGATNTTIGANSGQFVLSGGTATGTKINTGGTEVVENGATASAATIAGGTVSLEVGGPLTPGLRFSAVTGGNLTIESTTLPTVAISGFIAGDTIKLAGVVYNSKDTVTVATAGTVTINTPGTSYKLDIAGATVGETDFHFGPGSVLTKSAAKMMGFLAPETLAYAPWLTPMAAPSFAELFGGSLPAAAPESGGGFAAAAAQPDPALIHGVGFGAFTISDNVRLEMGAIHHGSPI